MFFSLSPTPDNRFNLHERHEHLWFSHDQGWHKLPTGWYKGYGQKDFGNWCKVEFSQGTCSLSHDRYRGFPLWWNSNTKTLTNLLGTGQSIWANETVTIKAGHAMIQETDTIGTISAKEYTTADVVDKVADLLVSHMSWLQSNLEHLPKRLFLTGGSDTAMLYAAAKYIGLDFESLDHEFFAYDWFANQNIMELRRNHWAYKQIHHWTHDCILITGSCGDEFFFRGPQQAAILAAWHGIDLEARLQSNDSYHHRYFLTDKNVQHIRSAWLSQEDIKNRFPTQQDLKLHLFDMNINDHQHWHLGRTLTYTPLKDLEFTKMILALPLQDLLRQITDAEINRRVILRLHPQAAVLVSHHKNFNHRSTLNGYT